MFVVLTHYLLGQWKYFTFIWQKVHLCFINVFSFVSNAKQWHLLKFVEAHENNHVLLNYKTWAVQPQTFTPVKVFFRLCGPHIVNQLLRKTLNVE